MALRREGQPPNRLRELRLARKFTLEHVALELDCSIATVHQLELLERTLSLAWMRKFAAVYGVSTASILVAEDNPSAITDDELALVLKVRELGPTGVVILSQVAELIVSVRQQSQG